MAITFTCSECDSDVKVKDEFAGRKIKCPRCKAVVSVPADEDEDMEEEVAVTSAKKPARKSAPPPDDEDEELEEKPTKKKVKKKKKQGGNGLLYAIAGGGVAAIGILLVVVFLFVLPGRNAPKEQAQTKKVEEKKEPPKEDKKEEKKGEEAKLPPKKKENIIIRTRDLIEMRPLFREVAIAYQGIITETGKAPKDKEDFRKYLRGSAKIMEYLDSGYLQFIYGVHPNQMTEGASNTIIGYEPYADGTNRRMVMLGDGSVREVTEDEFKGLKKAK